MPMGRRTITPSRGLPLESSVNDPPFEGLPRLKKVFFFLLPMDVICSRKDPPCLQLLGCRPGTNHSRKEKSTMQQIVEKLRNFGCVDEGRKEESKSELGSVEEIFSAESTTLPNTRGGYALEECWNAPYQVSEPSQLDKDARFHWKRRKDTGEVGNTDKEMKNSYIGRIDYS
eukprot:Gb_28260 [translate_table: standard]